MANKYCIVLYCIVFLSVIFITLVAFSSGKQQYISNDWIDFIFIEHSYGRKRNKCLTCTFLMGHWGPRETCCKLCLYTRNLKKRGAVRNSMIRSFIKEEKRRIHSWTKIITYAFGDIEASAEILKFYFGEKAKM